MSAPTTTTERKLTAAVVQHALTGRVLMLGYMDDEALAKTRETGEVYFWSRSRKRLWKKGESSGNVLQLVDIKADCDADAWLVRALPAGPTCHTGSQTCFGTDGKEPAPTELEALYQTIRGPQERARGHPLVRQAAARREHASAKRLAKRPMNWRRSSPADRRSASSPRRPTSCSTRSSAWRRAMSRSRRSRASCTAAPAQSGLDEKAARKK